MKVLVACEYSGVVREAFKKVGCSAYSNDILPTRIDGNHFQMDIYDAIDAKDWDLIIMHVPCTALAVSGNAWYGDGMPKNHLRHEAVAWTKAVWEYACSKCPRVALENPVNVLGRMAGMKCTQYIQPWMFGHTESKKTGLWLKGLPKLTETCNMEAETKALPKNVSQRMHYLPPSKDRGLLRSLTYQGIADAMAEQWSKT